MATANAASAIGFTESNGISIKPDYGITNVTAQIGTNAYLPCKVSTFGLDIWRLMVDGWWLLRLSRTHPHKHEYCASRILRYEMHVLPKWEPPHRCSARGTVIHAADLRFETPTDHVIEPLFNHFNSMKMSNYANIALGGWVYYDFKAISESLQRFHDET